MMKQVKSGEKKMLTKYIIVSLFAIFAMLVCMTCYEYQYEKRQYTTVALCYAQSPEMGRQLLNIMMGDEKTVASKVSEDDFQDALVYSGYHEQTFWNTLRQNTIIFYGVLVIIMVMFLIFSMIWTSKYRDALLQEFYILSDSIHHTVKVVKAQQFSADQRLSLQTQEELERQEKRLRLFRKDETDPLVGKIGALTADLVKYYERLQDYQETLRKQMQSFTENIAHQLKTPLARIALTLDLMDETNWLGKREQCQVETEQIKPLVEGLLNVARLESGRVKMSKEALDLPLLLQDAVHKVKGWERYQWEWQGDVDELIYYGDEVWLLQGFFNLYENAASKTSDGGKIITRVLTESAGITVEIQDEGGGIPTEYLNILFDRFCSSNDQEMTRTGIGLNLAKEVMEKHHGRIGVHNEGQGAVFTIFLPVYDLKLNV